MDNNEHTQAVLVVPCSGVGKVHGLISREAVYHVSDNLLPGQVDTFAVCSLPPSFLPRKKSHRKSMPDDLPMRKQIREWPRIGHIHGHAYMLYSLLRIFGGNQHLATGEPDMSRRVNMTRLAVELSLAVMLGLGMIADARADSPAEGSAPTAGRAATALEKAAKDNKYLFIFFFAGQDEHTGAMNGVFQAAMAKMADRANGIAIYLADPAEKPIVDKYGVRGAPMPLVLAIAPTGAATRAFPKQFEGSQFQDAFVSPCTARCMKVIQDQHMILICVQNGKTQFNQEAMQGVKAFKTESRYGNGTEVVMLDPADKAEQHFLTDLQVDPQTATAVTVLVTPPGAPVARFAGAVTEEQITAKVKEAESGCGAGCSCHKH